MRKTDKLVMCEHDDCTNELKHSHMNTHSMWAVVQKVDTQGMYSHQCMQGQDFRFVNYQHFHCSHKHMQEGMIRCIQEHNNEEDLQPTPGGIMHKIVLGSDLVCVVCGAPLTMVAYRIPLTQGLPYHNSIDEKHEDETYGWCCSLDHAKQEALSVIGKLPEGKTNAIA